MRCFHYNDVIIGAIASQITSLESVYSAAKLGADQRKHQNSASLAFVRGIHRGPVDSPHNWPFTREMFPFDYVIMQLCVVKINIGQGWVFLCELDCYNHIASRGISRLSVNINIYPNNTQYWHVIVINGADNGSSFMLCYSTVRNQCWFFQEPIVTKLNYNITSHIYIYICIYIYIYIIVIVCNDVWLAEKHDRDMIMTPQNRGLL